MPRSHSQTSPRRGVIMARLFGIQHAEDFVGCTSRFVVGKRARIEWNRSAEKLCRKGSPFFSWQSIECVKQLARFAAHILSLDPPVWGSKLSIWHPLGHPGDRDNPMSPKRLWGRQFCLPSPQGLSSTFEPPRKTSTCTKRLEPKPAPPCPCTCPASKQTLPQNNPQS